jgi:hypothetical protein
MTRPNNEKSRAYLCKQAEQYLRQRDFRITLQEGSIQLTYQRCNLKRELFLALLFKYVAPQVLRGSEVRFCPNYWISPFQGDK